MKTKTEVTLDRLWSNMTVDEKFTALAVHTIYVLDPMARAAVHSSPRELYKLKKGLDKEPEV
jgi:hypothetical protein